MWHGQVARGGMCVGVACEGEAWVGELGNGGGGAWEGPCLM